MIPSHTMPLVCLFLLLGTAAAAQPAGWVSSVLGKRVLDPKEPAVEVQVFTSARVPEPPQFRSAEEWRQYAEGLRRRILDEVVFRGRAAEWRTLPLRVEWLDRVRGGSDYEIRKLRVEVVPGLWVAGLLYRPLELKSGSPAVLNLNGHEKTGNYTPYIQQRCIHLARSGVPAFNLEWFGRGQMTADGFHHYRMPQIDLTGTSGIAVFTLAMKKGLDVLESLPEVDRRRIGVTGLSGGGWQTIWLSALDERVAAANPVAGYSSYVTRSQWPELDLGDAEQTPSDFASVADYTHLTAMLAPRWLQVANNAKDNCCFRADYALGPLIRAARPVYSLLGVLERLRYHVNFGDGHNYDADNRRAFYTLLRDAFFEGKNFPLDEKPLEHPVRTAAELAVPLPEGNLDFHTLALRLAQGLPRGAELPAYREQLGAWQQRARSRLRQLVRFAAYDVDARVMEQESRNGVTAGRIRLHMGWEWTVPATSLGAAGARTASLVLSDKGRAEAAAPVEKLLANGAAVLAMDPFYYGESRIQPRDYLFAMLVAAVGERPLGVQASQIAAAARWLKRERGVGSVGVTAIGPRTSLAALIAAALEPDAIGDLELEGSFASLHEILEQSLATDRTPELFCFGLLEAFDIPQFAALALPRSVRWSGAPARLLQAVAPLERLR